MLISRGLAIQFDVIYALILRESRTRFGKHLLGYLWALIEPSIWISLFVVLFYFSKRAIPFGMDIITFIATGVVPFFLFRNCVRYGIRAILSNQSLLYFSQIHVIDFIIARVFLESAGMILFFWIIIGVHELYFGVFTPNSLLTLLGGLYLSVAFGAGATVALCFANVFFPAIERTINRFIRVLFFASGTFFAVNELPRQLQEILLWNPLLHIITIVRTGWNPAFDNPEVTAFYPLGWAFGLLVLGLGLMPLANRRRYRP